ncbi:MAG TPA: acyloxyacyl hydrolase, partial [Thermoanaerobaculia bacterium]|nr:acyloxyacyl hydrolase [Thermoanaerobaculia bacterium]
MRLWIARAGSAALSLFTFISTPALGAAPLLAAEPVEVAAGAGEVEVLEDGRGQAIDLQVRFPPRRFTFLPRFVPEVAPILGTIATTRGAIYAYAGLRLDLPLGRRFHFSPSFSGGLYHQGEGQDLGGPVEFRSVVELSYALNERTRVGVSLDHLSNGGLFSSNPGSESLIFLVSSRLG